MFLSFCWNRYREMFVFLLFLFSYSLLLSLNLSFFFSLSVFQFLSERERERERCFQVSFKLDLLISKQQTLQIFLSFKLSKERKRERKKEKRDRKRFYHPHSSRSTWMMMLFQGLLQGVASFILIPLSLSLSFTFFPFSFSSTLLSASIKWAIENVNLFYAFRVSILFFSLSFHPFLYFFLSFFSLSPSLFLFFSTIFISLSLLILWEWNKNETMKLLCQGRQSWERKPWEREREREEESHEGEPKFHQILVSGSKEKVTWKQNSRDRCSKNLKRKKRTEEKEWERKKREKRKMRRK